MKKIYENMDLRILFFQAEDVLTLSTEDSNDNTGDLPEFPEFME